MVRWELSFSRFSLLFLFLFLSLPAHLRPQDNPPVRDPLNRELPSWLTLGIQSQLRLEGIQGIGFDSNEEDAYVLSRQRLEVGIQPSKYFKVSLQGQDSRIKANDPERGNGTARDVFDLREAYVTIGDEENGWWDARVGRQELAYGTERLVGIDQWANTPRTFDAAQIGFHRSGNRVDFVAGSVVVVDPDHFNKRRDGENFYGIYSSLGNVVPGTVFEPHIFYRTRPSASDEGGETGEGDTYTAGFRTASNWKSRWDYQVEMDWQFGTLANDDLRAFMGLWGIGYKPAAMPWQSRFLAEYTYASGDSREGDGKIETFDQLYPRAHRIWGIADRVGGRNSKQFLTGYHFRPAGKLQVLLDHHFFWLASANDGLYRNNGRLIVAAPAGGAVSAEIGRELDLQLVYTPSPYFTIGAGVARFFSGEFLKETTPGGSYTYPYIFLRFQL